MCSPEGYLHASVSILEVCIVSRIIMRADEMCTCLTSENQPRESSPLSQHIDSLQALLDHSSNIHITFFTFVHAIQELTEDLILKQSVPRLNKIKITITQPAVEVLRICSWIVVTGSMHQNTFKPSRDVCACWSMDSRVRAERRALRESDLACQCEIDACFEEAMCGFEVLLVTLMAFSSAVMFDFVDLLLQQNHPVRGYGRCTTIARRHIGDTLCVEIPERQAVGW